MTVWALSIPGEPVAKGRPRATIRGGKAATYTPARTARWESHAAWTLKQAWGEQGTIVDACALTVEAVFSRPQRLCTKKLALTFQPHVSRPDADNVLKAAADACEKAGIVLNDALAWDARVSKRYARVGEQPHVRVSLQWNVTT